MTADIAGRSPIVHRTRIDDELWDPRTALSVAEAAEVAKNASRIVAAMIQQKYEGDAAAIARAMNQIFGDLT